MSNNPNRSNDHKEQTRGPRPGGMRRGGPHA